MNIRYLILPLTTRCNLSCSYCYNGDPSDPKDMSEALLDKALALVEEAGEGPFHLQLTGGEPTLVPELIALAARRARELTRPCTIGIQTNGTRLTSELADLFDEFDIQVGVSLDGPPSVQEALRGRAAQTLNGLKLLEVRGIPFRVTTVISQRNVGSLKQLVWLLAGFSQARGIGLDLLVQKGRTVNRGDVLPAEVPALRDGVRRMIEALKAVNGRRRIPLQLREWSLIEQLLPKKGEKRSFCRACRGQSIAVHPDGRLFPCGQTLGDPRFAAGAVEAPDIERLNGLLSEELASDRCRTCPLEDRCPGDCPSRIHYNRARASAQACELYRTIWETVYPEERSLESIS